MIFLVLTNTNFKNNTNSNINKGDIQNQVNEKDKSSGANTKENKKNSSDSFKETNKPSDIVKLIAEKRVGTFIDYINNKQYENAYSMLNKEYIDTFKVSLEQFKGKYNYKRNKMYVIRNIDTHYGIRLVASVDIVDEKDVKEGNPNPVKETKYISLYDDGSIDDIGIVSIKSMNESEKKGKVEVSLLSQISQDQSTIFQVKINNHSENNIQLKEGLDSIQATGMDAVYEHHLYNGNPDYSNVEGFGESDFFIFFNTGKKIDKLTFNFADGTKIEIKLKN